MNFSRKKQRDAPELEVGKESIPFSNLPAYLQLRCFTILVSNQLYQIQEFNLENIPIPLRGSKILFEFVLDHFERKMLNNILDQISIFNKKRPLILNQASKIEFIIINRDDEHEKNLKFLDSIAKWRSLNQSSEFLLQIGFRNTRSEDEMMRYLEAQTEVNCIINDGWFLMFSNWAVTINNDHVE